MKMIIVGLTVISFGVGVSPARAFDCSANVGACIDLNKGKPNAETKCQAAGQSCAKKGTFCRPL
jgi:hypothetical protein